MPDGVRTTYTYTLQPTAQQQGTLALVLRRCRALYHAGLQERRDAWQQCRISVNFAMQSAQWPDITAVRPDYRDITVQVLQDVLHRLHTAFAAFSRRVKNGEQ